MNASPEMNFDDLLRVKLAVLQRIAIWTRPCMRWKPWAGPMC
jgi:hypothetical protein